MGLRAYRKVIVITLTIALSAVALGATAVAGFYYKQSKHSQPTVATSAPATPQDLIQRVSTLYNLPSDEQPTVAQIQHQDKLKDQAFFSNAQDGDSILIYAKAKLAIIYRQSTNKIINAGPVNYSDSL